jgi:ATP-binding cassette subfamily B protein
VERDDVRQGALKAGRAGDLGKLLGFVRPYARSAILALVMLATLVVLDLALPRLIQRIIDRGIAPHDRGVVVQTSLVMLGISAVSTVIAIANNVFSVRVGEAVARDLRDRAFSTIQRFSYQNLDRNKTGELLVRLTSDVAQVKMLVQISLRIGTRAPLLMVGSMILMVLTSGRLALVILPLLLLTSVFIGLFIVKMEPRFRAVQRKLDALNDVLQENVAGARLVKAFVRSAHEQSRFEVKNVEMTEQSIRTMQLMSSMQPVLTMCINVGVVVVIGYGGLEAVEGKLSLGALIAFSNYLLTTMTPLVMMTVLSNTWASGLASLRRLNVLLATEPDVVDAPDAVPLADDAPPSVAFERVSFRYDEAAEGQVLSDVDLVCEPTERGRTVAILGSTGAGKSTLVNLIPRFYDATAGQVRVGGPDVRSVTQRSLVSHVGIVPQETILFSGTVRDNVRYGRPDATDDEVIAAAKLAAAHDFITALPHGYDSLVGQRGQNFSGGQKQRLAIARALLMDPPILVLDDATSAVDVETETQIQRALGAGRARTTFVVAQRISTVLEADEIVVLERGKIVARGSHRELLASSDVYREIYESQLGEGEG